VSTSLAVWVGALLSLAAYSFLFKQENWVYSMSEHLMIGAATGWGFVMAYHNLRSLVFEPLTQRGDFQLLIPIVLGILLYGRYFKKGVRISRVPVAFMVALTSGVAVRGAVQSEIIQQLTGTMIPLNSINNVLLVVGVLAVLWYFFLSFKRGGPAGRGFATFGRYVMMAAFGSIFASTVAGRFSVLIAHFQYLIYTWLGYTI
jgi:hypothetical protein